MRSRNLELHSRSARAISWVSGRELTARSNLDISGVGCGTPAHSIEPSLRMLSSLMFPFQAARSLPLSCLRLVTSLIIRSSARTQNRLRGSIGCLRRLSSSAPPTASSGAPRRGSSCLGTLCGLRAHGIHRRAGVVQGPAGPRDLPEKRSERFLSHPVRKMKDRG
jgi:hypothetical protein